MFFAFAIYEYVANFDMNVIVLQDIYVNNVCFINMSFIRLPRGTVWPSGLRRPSGELRLWSRRGVQIPLTPLALHANHAPIRDSSWNGPFQSIVAG